ncbi:MAG TPA: hypothetical protein VFF27_11430 [Bacteroidia bacterium]|jgi:hypothetical protein|nr:hypothetical protein [Bacteroidia bacterium]
MVLIVSESSDHSTNDVIDWLRFYKVQYLRINEYDMIKIDNVNINCSSDVNITFSVNGGKSINTNQISAYWFRRGFFNFFDVDSIGLQFKNKEIENKVTRNLKSEVLKIGDLFQHILEKKNKVGSSYTADNNKLIHQLIARTSGLETPISIICTSKVQLKQFYVNHSLGIITKPISDTLSVIENNKYYNLYTNVITEKDIELFPEFFYPTLVQEKIEKKYEVRSFFLKNKFYSMAIFSQNDEKTKVDFRRYNRQKQNYRVPFNLPSEIKNKLRNLCG